MNDNVLYKELKECIEVIDNLEYIGKTRVLIIKKAVEKQVPAKPLPETRYYGNGMCPQCSAVFIDKSTNYCGNCGQRLYWGEQG